MALSPLTDSYDYSATGAMGVDTLPWCLPDSPSAYLDDPVCDYASLARGSNSGSVYPNLGPINWTAGYSDPLAGMTYGPPSSLLPPDPFVETDSDGCDQDTFTSISDPDAPGYIASAEPRSHKRTWSEDSALDSADDRAKAAKAFKSRIPGRRHGVQLRTASRKPRKPSTSSCSSNGSASSMSIKRSPSEEPDDDLTPEERRARRNHNLVEKQYRNRLNAQFERLLAVLPVDQLRGNGSLSGDGKPEGSTIKSSSSHTNEEKRMSKAEVLDLATKRIRALEMDRDRLVRERKEILRNIQLMMAGVAARQQGVGVNVSVGHNVSGMGVVGVKGME